ncbi:hypothetical protein GCM10023169_12520 [Georgenia halophila]|uniref:CBU-0592-like domain-containing protein n=1 Tax=Georgenia halophila TaxID=620889 RepID=A0ABP8L2Z5_9MICO
MPEFLVSVVASLGWIGVAVHLFAYARISSGRMLPASLTYQTLNVTGALAVGASSAASGAWPSAVANFIWIGIGFVAIVALRRHILERRLRAARQRAAELAEKRFRRSARRSVISPAGATVDDSSVDLEAFPERAAPSAATRPAGRSKTRRRRSKVAA